MHGFISYIGREIMGKIDSSNIIEHFRNIEDPRIERNKKHLVWDIISLTICAVVCGCETWEEIELYGKEKHDWLSTILQLPNGIPSHDTIRRLFIRLNPEQLQQCFLSWVEAVRKSSEGEIVAIDGKTARRSHDRLLDKAPLHMVSAWAHENRLILGQVKTDEKSNEITAIPQLLKLLELTGSIVTIDAIGTQKEIAKAIVEKKADYVLAVKANNPTLHEELQWFFGDIDLETDKTEGLIDTHRDVDKDHGRIEIRECICSEEIDWLKPSLKGWTDVRTIAMVKATRIIGEKESQECRYYLSSLEPNAELISTAVRAHWGVENSVHWVLDMVFREDESRMRMGNSPENFAILRRMALNLVRRDMGSKKSLKGRRKICGWNNQYLENLLFAPDEAFLPRDDS
jgi:predicted transposase YbfD/YdcC